MRWAAQRSSVVCWLDAASPNLLRVIASVALASCTLAQDDFEPVRIDSAALTPPAEAIVEVAPEAVPARDVAGCTASLPCPAGFDCVGELCLPSAGSCVDSEDPAACSAEICRAGACGAPECVDGLLGSGETDVDCGGVCAACAEGQSCRLGSDCQTGACLAGVCATPNCSDGAIDQDETGADCGGTVCERCGQGVSCASDTDCSDGLVCGAAARVCSPQTCQDGTRNGAEAGIDCGGGCVGCSDGAACALGSDCASGVCGDGTCAAAVCSDGVRNADETDVDCGGACTACSPGLACGAASDCQSGVCANLDCADGVTACCQSASCADGVKNGSEGAVDCGGDSCPRCALESSCNIGSDCVSNVCAGGSCQELCADGEQDGDESAVDCGGSELGCARCDDRQGCASGDDCASGRCDGSTCGSCADGLENGAELGLDCGSGEPGCPACPRCTLDNSIDLGGRGTLIPVTADACAKITSFPGYAPTLIEAYGDGPYPVPFAWRQECTGQTGSAVFQSPFQQLPLTGIGVECPVIFDLGGSEGPLLVRWY